MASALTLLHCAKKQGRRMGSEKRLTSHGSAPPVPTAKTGLPELKVTAAVWLIEETKNSRSSGGYENYVQSWEFSR